jgi:uncharacterized Zn-binding protein involved in type VI secretion
MGKPAARVGDQTAHGGVITGPGVPMVLIGGMPASVMGDMETCPLVNPGVPPPPHVGGNIIATCVSVLIGGKPAARMGDSGVCAGPPTTIVGGCPTVLIGDGGPGGGGGAGGESKESAQAATTEAGEDHYLDVKFVDKGGKPITGVQYDVKAPDGEKSQGPLTGEIKKTGVKEGNHEITLKAVVNAQWSIDKASVGEKVKLKCETTGIKSGEKAVLEVFIKDNNFSDHLLHTINSKVDNGKIEEEWELEINKELLEDQDGKEKKGGYSSPKFFFKVTSDGINARSGILSFKDYLELEYKDEDGNPIGDVEYKLTLSNGVIKEGKLDKNGYAKIENVPPGKVEVVYGKGNSLS